MATQRPDSIRMVTWLAPGLPLALFEQVRTHVENALKATVSLESRTKLSGPEVGSLDPFADGLAEVGFLCAPAAVPHTVRAQAGFELLGLAPLFDDPRYKNQPTCYCDLVVHEESTARSLNDLQGLRFGYNDTSSLSGWLGLATALKRRGTTTQDFFGDLIQTGGHNTSLAAIRERSIDVASIDSNVLRTHPEALNGLKVVDSVGPWPSQPVVVRSSLEDTFKHQIREALLGCGPWPAWGFVGFREQTAEELESVPSAAGTVAKTNGSA